MTVEVTTPEEAAKFLREHLKSHCKFMRKIRKNDKPPNFLYYCQEEFVLKNGKPHITINHDWSDFGEPRNCFGNSYALAKRMGYTYVEGYAIGIIPVQHAWCLDEKGAVVDSTWTPDMVSKMKARAYYGVEMDFTFVTKTITSRKMYGVIDNMEQRFPLLRGVGDWRKKCKSKNSARLNTSSPSLKD